MNILTLLEIVNPFFSCFTKIVKVNGTRQNGPNPDDTVLLKEKLIESSLQ